MKDEGLIYRQGFPKLKPEKKLRELILYIAARCERDPTFGAVKLAKILFYVDFVAYSYTGRPITGAVYQRLANGPAPERLRDIRNALEKERAAAVVRRAYFDKTQDRLVALKDPDLNLFSGREIAIVDCVIQELWAMNAREVSLQSHGPAWRITKPGEMIPYELAFLDEEGYSDGDVARAKELLRQGKMV
jgi:hypothetical protein